MFWKAVNPDVAALKEQLAAQERESEAARHDLRLSLRKLATAIASVPLEDAVDSIGGAIGGRDN
jgi:hypothetical protein